MNTFIKNWSLLSVSSVVQQVASFFCMIRIARLLAPEGFGSYLLILTVVAVTTLVASLGLPQIITRIIARRGSVLKNSQNYFMAFDHNGSAYHLVGAIFILFNGLSEWIV